MAMRPVYNKVGVPSRLACLVLASTDRIRALNFPDQVVELITRVVNDAWKKGLQESKAYKGGGWQWQLKGDPWEGQGSDAVPCRRLVATLLSALSNNGWHLLVATTIGKKSSSKDSLIFRPGPPRNQMFFSISFNEYDKIRLIDSPSSMVMDAFSQAVSNWPRGLQKTKTIEPNCLEFKLRGEPWASSDGQEINQSLLLGCEILSALEDVGWDLAASVNITTGIDWLRDIPVVAEWMAWEATSSADTWFFASRA